jgi:hypothetical protein
MTGRPCPANWPVYCSKLQAMKPDELDIGNIMIMPLLNAGWRRRGQGKVAVPMFEKWRTRKIQLRLNILWSRYSVRGNRAMRAILHLTLSFTFISNKPQPKRLCVYNGEELLLQPEAASNGYCLTIALGVGIPWCLSRSPRKHFSGSAGGRRQLCGRRIFLRWQHVTMTFEIDPVNSIGWFSLNLRLLLRALYSAYTDSGRRGRKRVVSSSVCGAR